MFTKHVYTCPDVIHMRRTQMRNSLAAFGGGVALMVVGTAYGWYLDRKEQRDLNKFNGETVTD